MYVGICICVPQYMRDANIVTLYKNMGDRGDCNNLSSTMSANSSPNLS